MLWAIVTLKKAEKALAAIPNPERSRIEEAIDQLAKGPYDCGLDVKPLKGRPEWRLRVGQRRVLFLVDKGKITITVISVASRGGILSTDRLLSKRNRTIAKTGSAREKHAEPVFYYICRFQCAW